MENLNKTILVTGSSTGFGRITVQTLAEEGHKVFATMRDINGKNQEHANILSQWAKHKNLDVAVVELDVTSDNSVAEAAKTILSATGGKIDVVINNAGIYGLGLQETFTVEDYKNIFEVNVFGPARVNNQFLPLLRKQGSGLIIQVSSVVGRIVMPFQGVYTATKFAVEALQENLHYELAPLGIDAVIVQPGPFLTEVFGKLYQPANSSLTADYGTPATHLAAFGETFKKMMGGDVPNQPQQVADAIVKLLNTPQGQRPLRTVVDQMMGGTAEILNETASKVQEGLLNNIGLADLLATTIK